jgi:hypothetical protein
MARVPGIGRRSPRVRIPRTETAGAAGTHLEITPTRMDQQRSELPPWEQAPVWRTVSAFVPGGGHLERGIPCQDRAAAWTAPRPALAVLDGRGSSALSHEGAEAALQALRREIDCLGDRLRAVLDEDPDEGLAALAWQGLSQWLYTVAARVQRELADASGRKPADYEFTLTLAVAGTRRAGWMGVGDSPLVASRHGILFLPRRIESVEFANQTRFVQAAPGRSPGLSGGLIPAAGLDLLAAMSDGAAARLVDLRGQVAAEAVRALGSLLARGELDEPLITAMLEEAAWNDVTRDDRSVAMLARGEGAVQVVPYPTKAEIHSRDSWRHPSERRLERTVEISKTAPTELRDRILPMWIRLISLVLLAFLATPAVLASIGFIRSIW